MQVEFLVYKVHRCRCGLTYLVMADRAGGLFSIQAAINGADMAIHRFREGHHER